jgi:hypothetical protein
VLRTIALVIFSPTRAIVDLLKRGDTKKRGRVLKCWSLSLFVWELTAAIITVVLSHYLPHLLSYIIWPLLIYSYSRCNEIAFAFYRDAFSKLGGEKSRSDITPAHRIKMAMRSYYGLIFNFAIIYYFVPISGLFHKAFNEFFDAFYFSVVTITTLGYGDNYPEQFFSKLLIVYQVLCGLLLIVVALGTYLSGGKSKNHA